MFDKLKQLNELRKMQAEIKKEKVTASENGVSITLNGGFEIEDVKLNPALPIEEQEKLIKNVANQAVQKMQEAIRKHIPIGF